MAAAARNAAKAADHTLYHLAPQGFWKKFRDVVAVNPDISTGIPIATLNRFPQPGSRPELYATPATKASDPAQNPYWKRDVRRNYPRLSVVTQAQLSQFLLQSPDLQAVSPPAPTSADKTAESTSVANLSTPKDLTQALETLAAAGKKAFSEVSHLPIPVSPHKKWIPERAEDAPHDRHAYFPMILVK